MWNQCKSCHVSCTFTSLAAVRGCPWSLYSSYWGKHTNITFCDLICDDLKVFLVCSFFVVLVCFSFSASVRAHSCIHRVALTRESAGCHVCVMVPGDLEPVVELQVVKEYLQSDHEAQSVAKHCKHTNTKHKHKTFVLLPSKPTCYPLGVQLLGIMFGNRK